MCVVPAEIPMVALERLQFGKVDPENEEGLVAEVLEDGRRLVTELLKAGGNLWKRRRTKTHKYSE